ncbi:MAG: outer membrane protein assembly factor BamA [Nitrospirae bacterium RBG_13_43_8]|nr:MAG: outer membrane protein assembly factor BamA [Nitrospirae bacterium RBG_13_43_8]
MKWKIRNRERRGRVRRLLPLLSYFLFFYFSLFPLRASGSIVNDIEITGLYSIEKGELIYLLDIKVGSPTDREKVGEGIKRAFLKGIFEDISIEVTDGDPARVTIAVKERDFIDKVCVEGNYSLSRKFIKNNFPLREEQIMRGDMIEPAIRDLGNEIARRGFPHAGISVKIEKGKNPHRVTVHLLIDTGKPEIIKEIIIIGGTDEAKTVMKLSGGDIYDQVELEKDIERIRTYYREEGYFNPRIGPPTFTDGVLKIPVDTGKQLLISTEGNSVLSTKTLRKEMPFFEAENFTDDLVDEAVSKIVSLYHAEGYPFGQVAPVITSKDDLISLHFFIFEGKKVKVRTISFNNISLPEKNLQGVMLLKKGGLYNPDLIDADKESIMELYNALGYLAAAVDEFETKYDESTRAVDISIKIDEGAKTEIGKVEITGASQIPDEELTKTAGINAGDPYNEVDISDARYRILQLYNSRGFVDALVSVKRYIEGQKVSLTFQITEGEVTFFGETIVSGNYHTRYEVFKRELKHDGKMPFDYSVLAKERQSLYKLGLFTNIDVEVLDRYDHKKDTLLKVKEGNAGAVEFGLGYADYEKFRGFIDLSYRNLWGMNRQASLRLELSSLDKRIILQYLEPWFLGRQLPFRTFLLYEDREEINLDTGDTLYRLNRYSATAGIEKQLSTALKADLYYEFSLVDTFNVQPDVILTKEDTGTLAISALKPGIVFDTRDNPFDPKKGVLAGISLKAASPLLLSETDFLKLLFQGSAYQQLDKRFVIALSLRGGLAWGYHGTEQLPIVERFFLGGRTTVRGYEQDTLGPKGPDGNPTGGNAFLCGNVELRSYLGRGIGIVTFLDGGNVWQKVGEIELGSIKYSTGLGLRYNTPVGPLRVDYGYKLQREEGESAGVLHFAIGHAF